MEEATGRRSHSFLHSLLILGRVSNLPTVWTNVAVGWFVAGGIWNSELGWLLAGVSLLYVAGMTLNDAFDEKWDGENAPERPIPSGNLTARTVWIIGVTELLAGMIILVEKTAFRIELLGLLVAAILAYNWLHKRWAASVIIMACCRVLVYLGAASAVTKADGLLGIPLVVEIVGVIMIVYISGLTLAAREERNSDATPGKLKPVVRLMLVLPVLLPLLAARQVPPDLLHSALAIVGLVAVWSWLVIFRSTLAQSIPKGISLAIAGISLYDAAVVVFSDWSAAMACLLAFLLVLGAQRYIPAT